MKYMPTKVSQPLSISTNCPQHKTPLPITTSMGFPRLFSAQWLQSILSTPSRSADNALHLQHFFHEVSGLTLFSPATNPNPSILAMKKSCFKKLSSFSQIHFYKCYSTLCETLNYQPVITLSQSQKLLENTDPETANKAFNGLLLPMQAHMVKNMTFSGTRTMLI